MRAQLQRRLDDEAGFTLIELLVVVVIIGILAGFAVSVFISQRQKGYDAAAKSDLKNIANFEEIYLNDFGVYGLLAAVKANEPDVNPSKGVTVTLVDFTGQNGYCLSAKHKNSSNTWYYDSQAGGLQASGTLSCPVSVGGTPGDSLTG